MLIDDVKKILINEDEISEICKSLGERISKDYNGRNLIVIGLLKGCLPFMSDLVKRITIPVKLDYMDVSSYKGTSSTGTLIINKDIEADIKGYDVIVVDDIVDTGNTIYSVFKLLGERGASTVEACALLDKPEGRTIDVNVKYKGACVPKEFVVGYGLDYNELYRNLPFVGVLKEEIYK